MERLYALMFLLTFLVIATSCATLINSKETNLTIITSEPAQLVLHGDTLQSQKNRTSVFVNRSKSPLLIQASTDSLTKTISVKSINSFAYWLNANPYFLPGFLIDKNKAKSFTYPMNIYIDLTKKDSLYLPYAPLEKPLDRYLYIFKFTPLKIAGLMHPSIEASLEKRTSHNFSTQIMASYLLPFGIFDIGNDYKFNTKGFRASIEERFYLNRTAPLGSYLSIELDYLKNKYDAKGLFYDLNDVEESTSPWYELESYRDVFKIHKKTVSLSFKIGHQFLNKRFSIDLYGGLGVRYRDVKHIDRMKPDDVMAAPRHPNVHHIANTRGKYWTVNLPLNAKIGWVLGKR